MQTLNTTHQSVSPYSYAVYKLLPVFLSCSATVQECLVMEGEVEFADPSNNLSYVHVTTTLLHFLVVLIGLL